MPVCANTPVTSPQANQPSLHCSYHHHKHTHLHTAIALAGQPNEPKTNHRFRQNKQGRYHSHTQHVQPTTHIQSPMPRTKAAAVAGCDRPGTRATRVPTLSAARAPPIAGRSPPTGRAGAEAPRGRRVCTHRAYGPRAAAGCFHSVPAHCHPPALHTPLTPPVTGQRKPSITANTVDTHAERNLCHTHTKHTRTYQECSQRPAEPRPW